MSKVFFISDLHLGHKKILEFSPKRGGTDMQSHSEWLVHQWNTFVSKQDLTWVLGDVCFDQNHMKYLRQMNGVKHLILGNHDNFGVDYYKNFFNKIHGFMKYKGFWLSHCPMHSDHLRDFINIHGHLHHSRVEDKTFKSKVFVRDARYWNVSVEQLNGIPRTLEELKVLYD